MSWGFAHQTNPVAQKEYRCQASDWITNACLDERDFEPEDWATIQKAKAEGFKILPGTRYVKTKGRWEGEWTVFLAREDLDVICRKYDLYEE